MDQALLLFALRLLSALTLLGFVGLLAWFSYQDMKGMTRVSPQVSLPNAYLEVVATTNTPPAVGAHLPLQPVTSIGRDAGCTIVLADDYASSEHALLALRGDHWLLEDRHSRNGTLLNDQPVSEPVVVSAGDVITIGDTQLRLQQLPASTA